MSRLVEYCNLTTDLQNAYKEIEMFAYQKLSNSKFSSVSGQIYSQLGQAGYVGALYIDRIPQTQASSAANINTTNTWYYNSTLDTLYILTSVIGSNEISIASDSWANIKTTAREDASQEIENFLYMYNRPLPFRKNASGEYDRDIVRACAYLTCARIVEMDNPENPLASNLRNKVWNDENETGILYDYMHDKKKFSFEATNQSYNGNIIPNTSNTGTGYIEVAGYSDDNDSYEYEVTITTAGAVGTAKYSLSKNGIAIGTRTTYISYAHLHADVYVKFSETGTFAVGDKWKVQFDGRTKKQKETGLSSVLMTWGGRSNYEDQDDVC